jgi:hypothetical protein
MNWKENAMFKALVCLLMLLSTVVSAAQARLIENWPYDRLMHEADVVVIASVRS